MNRSVERPVVFDTRERSSGIAMHYYGMFLSLFHSVQIFQAEGIPLEQYITLLGEQGKNYGCRLCT